jgi:hypothetical protein
MHMTFASRPCRLAFAPLPAPPGFSRCRFDSWSATDFLSTATPNSPVALTFSLPSCTRWACHSHFSRLGDNSHRGDRRIAHPLRCFRASRLRAHDRRATRRNFHRPSAQRLQLDQATLLRRVGGSFRSAGVRDGPALSRRSTRALLWRRRAVVARWFCQRTSES